MDMAKTRTIPEPLTFLEPGPLRDDDLELVLVETYPGDTYIGYSPSYRFEMRSFYGRRMGMIDLRIGNAFNLLMYGGHIGYRVYPAFQGNRYAARSCQLLFPLAKRHGISPLWITCNPDNMASRRTRELAGAELVEIVEIPPTLDMYEDGERFKCRYRVSL